MKAKGRVGINVGALGVSNLWRVGTSFILQLWIAYQLGLALLGQYTIVLAYLHVSQILSELGLPTYLVSRLAHAPDQSHSYLDTAFSIL